MKEDEVKRAIIIVQQQMTNFAREKVWQECGAEAQSR